MKTFNTLTVNEKEKAIETELLALLEKVISGELALGDGLQERIDSALGEAEKMQTPWFAHEYLLEDDIIENALRGIALEQAQDAIYAESHEYVRPVPKAE